jgi:hypothetical protein
LRRLRVKESVHRLAAIALFLLSACTPQQTAPSPTATPVPTSSAQPAARGPAAVQVNLYERGLALEIPMRWTWNASFGSVNRATQRYFIAANGPLADLSGLPGNGDVDASALPSGRVVVEVESFCRFSCSGPTTETPLPLDWSAAAPLFERTFPSGRQERAIGFRWFDQALFLVARWADDAPPADIAAIADVVRSIRPEPAPPATGEYRGWAGVGPLANIPVGSVTLTPLPAGAVIRPPYRTYDNVPFYLVRGKQGIYAFRSRAFFDERCLIQYDSVADRLRCDVPGRSYEWTRFGKYLGPEPASNLTQHQVILRDGQVWVRYIEDYGRYESVPDEAAEY